MAPANSIHIIENIPMGTAKIQMAPANNFLQEPRWLMQRIP